VYPNWSSLGYFSKMSTKITGNPLSDGTRAPAFENEADILNAGTSETAVGINLSGNQVPLGQMTESGLQLDAVRTAQDLVAELRQKAAKHTAKMKELSKSFWMSTADELDLMEKKHGTCSPTIAIRCHDQGRILHGSG
jgi:hypothetical protein